MVKRAGNRNQSAVQAGLVDLKLGGFELLPQLGEIFDKVFSVNVLQFLRERTEVLLLIRSVLKPNGLVATTLQPRHRGATAADAHAFGHQLSKQLIDVGFRRSGDAADRSESACLGHCRGQSVGSQRAQLSCRSAVLRRMHTRGEPGLAPQRGRECHSQRHSYTAPGTGVEVYLECRHRDNGDGAIIRVLDRGPGVPAAELSHIFRPFYRVADARDRESGGVGLGLAIAERVARVHGGSIRAENRDGGGLEVVLSLKTAL
jgi:hypothetical protein